MKIVMLIDYLDSGGAQRQLFMLARLFKAQGAAIEVLTYYESDFFLPLFQEAQISVVNVSSSSKAGRIAAVRKAIRAREPDVLISFLKTPNILAELAGLPRRSFKIVVSERNTDMAVPSPTRRLQFWLHRLADAVVVNSHTQQRFLIKHAPWLRDKLHVISNCVDLDQFRHQPRCTAKKNRGARILVLGRVHPQKNPFVLAKALALLKRTHPELALRVDWYGEHKFLFEKNVSDRDAYLKQLQKFLSDCGLQDRFFFHRPSRDVLGLFRLADVFCLPSLYEGCSNVLGEAMACGLPVLASRAGDNDRLVADGENGFLFDAEAPEQVAEAIVRFCALDAQTKAVMGRCSRDRAEQILSQERFIREYMRLVEQLPDHSKEYCQ